MFDKREAQNNGKGIIRGADGRQVLRVVPYPDVPGDFASMLKIIEKGFEQRYPHIDLQFDEIEEMDSYQTHNLVEKLTSPLNERGAHIIEVDTNMLGELAKMNLLEPLHYIKEDFFLPAMETSMLDGVQYGVPHWVCGNYLLTKDVDIAQARNVHDLDRRMRMKKEEGPWLAGNFTGSTYFINYYMQAWGQNKPDVKCLHQALIAADIDEQTAHTLSIAASLMVEEGCCPCLDGTYIQEPDLCFERMMAGDYLAVQGFSECLWDLVQHGANPDDWHIIPLPLGDTLKNMIMADSYLVRKGLCAEDLTAVQLFIDYVLEPEVYRDIMFSGGANGEEALRYLLPARRSMFLLPGIVNNKYYKRMLSIVDNSQAFANVDVAVNRDRIHDSVRPYLLDAVA